MLTFEKIISTNSLLEASKSTSMNRYVIIFTILTIFYLPLGFVTVSLSITSTCANEHGPILIAFTLNRRSSAWIFYKKKN